MRIFMPVRLFKGGDPKPEVSVWTADEKFDDAPYILQRTTTNGTDININLFLDVETRDDKAEFVVLTPLIIHENEGIQIDLWGFEKLETMVDDFLWCERCGGSTELDWTYDETGGPGRWISTASACSSCCKDNVYLDPQLLVQWDPDPNDYGAFDRGRDE